MIREKIWDFWAPRYHRLWVQKKSLSPTRKCVVNIVRSLEEKTSLLDLGSGPGELVSLVLEEMEHMEVTAVDFSREMLQVSERKNPGANHILLDAHNLGSLSGRFDIVVCTHSLPYYKDKKKVLDDIGEKLTEKGRLILAFASGNSFYDKLVLFFVKLTTGPASYPSDKNFRELIEDRYLIEDRQEIKERSYMPTIAVYTLRRI